MDKDKLDIVKVLLKALNTVSYIFGDADFDETFVAKAMLDSGFKQSIFLTALGREDEKVEGAPILPLMGAPIYVDLNLKGSFVNGHIYAFGYHIYLENTPYYASKIEDVERTITISRDPIVKKEV